MLTCATRAAAFDSEPPPAFMPEAEASVVSFAMAPALASVAIAGDAVPALSALPPPLADAPSLDATAEFQAALASGGDLTRSRMAVLRKITVIFPAGMLAKQAVSAGQVGIGGYFDGAMGWLREEGVRVQRIVPQGEGTPEER